MNLSPQVSQFFAAGALFKLLNDAVAVKNNIPTPFPAPFYSSSASIKPIGTQVPFYRQTNNRAAAKAVAPGAPSNSIGSLPGSELVTMTGIESRENWPVPYDMLVGLESGLPYMVDRATIELNRNAINARNRLELFKTDQIHSILTQGKIWTDSTGTVLNNATGATNTIDMKVAVANQITKNGAGATYNIGDWSVTTTDIGLAIRTLRRANLKATGYDLNTVYYGVNVPGYLASNTTLKTYSFNAKLNASVVEGNEIPDGILGMNWVPVYKAFSGNGSFWAPDNFVSLSPPVGSDWYELPEFGQVVPAAGVASQLVESNADPVSGNRMQVKYGMFSYAYHNPDPYQMTIVNGYGCLPCLKVPGTYYFGTCS